MKFEQVSAEAEETLAEKADHPTEYGMEARGQGEDARLARRRQRLERTAARTSKQVRTHTLSMLESLARLDAKLEAEGRRQRETECGQTLAEAPEPPNSFNASRFSHDR